MNSQICAATELNLLFITSVIIKTDRNGNLELYCLKNNDSVRVKISYTS